MSDFSGNKTVLLVDDEEMLREVVSFYLKDMGLNVIEAESGKQAIELLESAKPDLIVSDIKMPNGTGIDILEHLEKKDCFSPPLIFITGFADYDAKDLISRGAVDVIPKPIDRDRLIKVIQSALG